MLTKKQINLLSFQLPDLEMILVEGGVFQMGGTEYEDEKPIHKVHISTLYMGSYPVTQALYKVVISETPSHFKGKRRPVENVSWEDARTFLEKLNEMEGIKRSLEKEGLKNHRFRLPSEAEWEYAARGGKYSEGYTHAGSDDLKQVGWYDGNSNSETKPVGLLRANELGLYDMSGNVYEWCEDDWRDSYREAPVDGSAWIDALDRATYRVIRGGGYFDLAVRCRPACRDYDSPDFRYSPIGFRLVLSPS